MKPLKSDPEKNSSRETVTHGICHTTLKVAVSMPSECCRHGVGCTSLGQGVGRLHWKTMVLLGLEAEEEFGTRLVFVTLSSSFGRRCVD
jgi:hypothetical protein